MTADLSHMQHRTGQTAAEAAAPHPRTPVMLAASVRLGELAALGDAGALRQFVHELQHGDVWCLDPWSLLEFHLLRLAAAPKPRIHVDTPTH
jgi:hypothetical protein